MDASPPDSGTHEPNPFEAPRASAGKSATGSGRVGSIFWRILGTILISLASLIAFVTTCVPVGFFGDSLGLGANTLVVACVVGGVTAIGVWLFLFRLLTKRRKL